MDNSNNKDSIESKDFSKLSEEEVIAMAFANEPAKINLGNTDNSIKNTSSLLSCKIPRIKKLDIKEILKEIFTIDFWSRNIKNLFHRSIFIFKYLYFFLKGDLLYYAASLSFYTIFALLPMLLIIFSAASFLPEFRNYLNDFKTFIGANFLPGNSDVFLDYFDSFISNSKKMGILGFFYALATSMLFFRNYQAIAARIYQSQVRGFWDSLSVYWTCMTLVPAVLFFSIYVSAEFAGFMGGVGYNGIVKFALWILPYLLIWGLFFTLFKISSNAQISTKNTLFSSFLTALLWSFSKFVFIYYVFYNKAYLTLYGSLSAVLFLLLWIYISWIILLFGMGLSRGFNEASGASFYIWALEAAQKNEKKAKK